jgi:hypothetical protein
MGEILSGESSLNWFISQIVSGEGSKELNSYRLNFIRQYQNLFLILDLVLLLFLMI